MENQNLNLHVGTEATTSNEVKSNGEPKGIFGLIIRFVRFYDKSFDSSQTVKNIREAKDIKQVVASQVEFVTIFYKNVLRQAQQSFLAALIASGIGLLFFIAAVTFLLLSKPQNLSAVSLISGALVEVIAGINFYLYGKQQNQFATFHQRLDRTQNILLAHSICDGLDKGDHRNRIVAELVLSIASPSYNVTSSPLTSLKNEKEDVSKQPINQ